MSVPGFLSVRSSFVLTSFVTGLCLPRWILSVHGAEKSLEPKMVHSEAQTHVSIIELDTFCHSFIGSFVSNIH